MSPLADTTGTSGPDRAVLPLDAIEKTVDSIESVQLPNGMIPWFEGGHCDPWNHVEAAMALSVGGRRRSAEHAYEWLRSTQHDSGAWFNYYGYDGSVEDARLDTNVCAYVAAGVWHHYLATGDRGFLESCWPMVKTAVGFVLSWQRPGGELVWSVREDGSPEGYALLTGSSSVYLSLRCAVGIAELMGTKRPEWELAAGRLRHAIAHAPERFAPKHRYAMDWYYPVLCGVLEGDHASERLQSRWDDFVMAGWGVRCVADQPWVTAAETAECAIACATIGQRKAASELMAWVQDQRDPDGSYTTGRVYPERSTFPHEERSTYSAAAVVLACDALGWVGSRTGDGQREGVGGADGAGAGAGKTVGFFRGEGLPEGLDLEEMPLSGSASGSGSTSGSGPTADRLVR
jgi:hypothetical protein